MNATVGYALVQMPEPDVAGYEVGYTAQQNIEGLKSLRQAFRFLDIRRYRGTGRRRLQALPSVRDDVNAMFHGAGLDTQSNRAARLRYREMIGEAGCGDDDPYCDDVLDTVEQARELHVMLDHPKEWEIVRLRRADFSEDPRQLGFDIGRWGPDHFSLIADIAVTPRWHPPPPESHSDVAAHFKRLNEWILFPSHKTAKEFLAYYRTQSWAEADSAAFPYDIIQVEACAGP